MVATVTTLPFLTAYDPPGASEGTLDPLGLYQIADQLAVALVPAVRERMRRVRFLTAMAVGALVAEGVEGDPKQRDAEPFLVWEWLVIEALVRARGDDSSLWGVPGTLVAQRALNQHGYLDARSYLKVPRIFGFNGVYKRLASHLRLVDVHLAPGPDAERLAEAWAKGLGFRGLGEAKPLLRRWSDALRRSLGEKPPRTKANWSAAVWAEMAGAFAPTDAKPGEKHFLRDRLLATDDRRLGALPEIWELQTEFEDDTFREELLHDRLRQREPSYSALLDAIGAYETFARKLQDAFDLLRAEGARVDVQGYAVTDIAKDADYSRCVKGLHEAFAAARDALGEGTPAKLCLQGLFVQRFGAFAEPMDAAACARVLCSHHEDVQHRKSAGGKRPWFDRIGPDLIYVRHGYRESRREIEPGHYVHDYRGRPIRNFYGDLS